MPDLYAYTDGACSGNPGPGGWGLVGTELSSIVRKLWAPVVSCHQTILAILSWCYVVFGVPKQGTCKQSTPPTVTLLNCLPPENASEQCRRATLTIPNKFNNLSSGTLRAHFFRKKNAWSKLPC